jgi:beta-xylosidase
MKKYLGGIYMPILTANNPIIWADYPDPDIIRVNDNYYFISTSMHTMPGCPILKSKDLVHWEIASYVYDTFENNDGHNLMDGKGIYGKGAWATSLKYNQGKFYVCFNCNDTGQFYIYQTNDIEKGDWQRHVIDKFMHDPALFFDDGRVFVIYGSGDIQITELTADATAIKEGGINQLLLSTPKENYYVPCEGSHAYKIDRMYYLLFCDWPHNERKRQLCYRSSHLLGPYESKIILDDDMGFTSVGASQGSIGVAQGGIVDTPEGQWYSIMMQDHGAVGRIPSLMPVTWEERWPMLGHNGKAPTQVQLELKADANTGANTEIKLKADAVSLTHSDEFEYEENKLKLGWQWNHNPNQQYWSVTKRHSFLRLETSHVVNSVLQAQNTLTQRTEGPKCEAEIKMDLTHMQDGDHAGLVALLGGYSSIGVQVRDGVRYIVVMQRDERGQEQELAKNQIETSEVEFKASFQFIDANDDTHDVVQFYYATEPNEWKAIGGRCKLRWTMEHFMGCRIGIFNYATLQSGGYVDIDYFRYGK